MSDHLVALADGWRAWRWLRVRGAGFPAEGVRSLAAPHAAAAADRLIAAQRDAADSRRLAEEALRRAGEGAKVDERRRLKDAQRRIAAGNVERALADAGAARAEVAAHGERDATVRARQKELDLALAADRLTTSRELRAWASAPRFREALAWQNRQVLHTGLAPLLRAPVEATDKSTRGLERLVAKYIQRYCTKNDTIGFFGPFGFGELAATPAARIEPGSQLLERRVVYFEYWAIDALAQVFASDDSLRPYAAPRRAPTIWVEGTTLLHPIDQRSELPPDIARVLASCDGERTAAALAAELGEDPDEVYALLGELAEQGLVTWTFEIPPATAAPEQILAKQLAAIPAEHPGGARVRDALASLVSARDRVAAAAGDAAAVDVALGELEREFEQLTQRSARRAEGQTYAGRTIVYEECRRDLHAVFGDGIVQAIADPLALLLQSARWYTYEIGRSYRERLDELYRDLSAQVGSPQVDFLRFWAAAKQLFPGSGEGIVREVSSQLLGRWSAIFRLDERGDTKRVQLSSRELGPQIAAAFAAPHPGWPSARHHSPDLLIAAPSVEAMAAGDVTVVLGEIHTGMNTVTSPVAVKEHPTPDQLIAAREADLPLPCIAPTWSRMRTRADFYSLSRHDFDLELGEGKSGRARDHVLSAAALVVERAETLVVRPRGGGPSFDIIAFLEHHLLAESFAHFDIFGARAYTPRIAIDRLVISRERWRFDVAELAALVVERPAAEQFVAIRGWAAQCGMPTHVFAKSDAEVKPFFVDFDSPILVDLFVRTLRKSQRIHLSEMLPSLGDLWLPDAAGQTYTCELRIAVLDGEPWRAGDV